MVTQLSRVNKCAKSGVRLLGLQNHRFIILSLTHNIKTKQNCSNPNIIGICLLVVLQNVCPLTPASEQKKRKIRNRDSHTVPNRNLVSLGLIPVGTERSAQRSVGPNKLGQMHGWHFRWDWAGPRNGPDIPPHTNPCWVPALAGDFLSVRNWPSSVPTLFLRHIAENTILKIEDRNHNTTCVITKIVHFLMGRTK